MKITLKSLAAALATMGLVSFNAAAYANDLKPTDPNDSAASPATEEPEAAESIATDSPVQRRAALRAIDALLAKLSREGKTGQGWNRFLGLANLRARLARPPLETLDEESATLRKTLRLFRRGSTGLNRPEFVAVERSLAAHLAGLSQVNSTDFEKENAELFAARNQAFAAWSASRSADDRRGLADTLIKLEERGLAGPQTRALVARSSHPNLVFHASERLLHAVMAQPVDDTSGVAEIKDGVRLRGVARTRGLINVALLDSSAGALIGVRVNGHVASRVTATKGPVHVNNNGSTNFVVNSSILLTGDGIVPGQTTARSSTDIDVQNVRTNFRGPLDRVVRRLATPLLRRQEGKLSAEANVEARARAEYEFASRLATMAADANRQLQEKFFKPLRAEGVAPRAIKFSSSNGFLHGNWLQTRGVQLGSPTIAPKFDPNAMVSVQIHESHLENFAWDLLAGRRMGPDDIAALMKKHTGKVPAELLNRDPNKDVTVEFDAIRPASFALTDNGATVVLHIASFSTNDRRYGAMNIQADYTFIPSGKRWQAVRQGDLKIAPPSGKLGSSQIAMRRILRTQFDKVFTAKIAINPIALSGPLAKLGGLGVTKITSYQGWLTAAFDPTYTRPAASGPRVAKAR